MFREIIQATKNVLGKVSLRVMKKMSVGRSFRCLLGVSNPLFYGCETVIFFFTGFDPHLMPQETSFERGAKTTDTLKTL